MITPTERQDIAKFIALCIVIAAISVTVHRVLS